MGEVCPGGQRWALGRRKSAGDARLPATMSSGLPRLPCQVTRGVMYTREEAEGKRLRHPFDTITGGWW